MTKELSRDLKVARERSGLSAQDLAHLLGCNRERISKIEHGKARITAGELMSLGLIYGQAAESLFLETIQGLTIYLKRRFAKMPAEPVNWSRKSRARLDTLNGLAHRLQALTNPSHANA